MLCEQPLPGFPVLLQLQLHLHSGNRTQHFLLRHSLRYQQLLHNKTLHSDLLLRSIRFPVQDITVRNTEQRNRRSGWKQSLSLLHPLPRLLLFRLLCSLPQQLSLLLCCGCLTRFVCAVRAASCKHGHCHGCCQYGCKNFLSHSTLLLLFIMD